jgi:ubiquinone/menaquinone biosynthesis C-methylase UbiE
MTFAISGAVYDRFMGRYSVKLAPLFAEFAGIAPGMRAIDVGCGPGALSDELSRRLGSGQVAAADPSPPLIEACRARLPDADVRNAPAEQLPWTDGEFDAALAQLVLSFMTDAERGAREMRRVVRAGGTVAACMWHEGASLELSHVFWESAATIDPALRHTERAMRFRKQGDIASLWKRIGLRDIEETFLEVRANYQHFDDFWEPLVGAPGPIGAFLASIDDERRAAFRDACRARLGNPQHAFELSARACAVRGRV